MKFALFRSITQGTPVHHGSHLGPNDKRQPLSYEYFKRSSPAGNPSPNNPGQPVSSAYPYGSSPSQSSASSAFNSPYPTNPTRQPTSYPIEQQLSSRQIIMSDYITSQQVFIKRTSYCKKRSYILQRLISNFLDAWTKKSCTLRQ